MLIVLGAVKHFIRRAENPRNQTQLSERELI